MEDAQSAIPGIDGTGRLGIMNGESVGVVGHAGMVQMGCAILLRNELSCTYFGDGREV